MGKRRGQGASTEDQYGESQISQDRDCHGGQFGGKRNTGGGTAGASRGDDMKFQRQVPKFLQQYAHLLGKGGQQNEDEPVTVGQLDKRNKEHETDDEGDDDCEKDALKRAMEENPELAKEFEGELNRRIQKAEAVELKEKGNKAFSAKKFEEAEETFTKCIELDPANEVYFGNRSAARWALKRFDEALADAEHATVLRPSWSRGWARAAAACMSLGRYAHAREHYERALKLTPEDAQLQMGLQKAISQEHQMIKENKVVFVSQKRQKTESRSASFKDASTEGKKKETARSNLLSFGNDGEE